MIGLSLGLSLSRHTGGGGDQAFTPASLFASGEAGVWGDPSPTTCFTDTSGATPAGAGDAVARINDSSGNGNNIIQSTVAARPLLKQTVGGDWYLDYSGTDDGMATAAIDFSASDKISVFASIEAEGSNTSVIVETAADYTSVNGSFVLYRQTSQGLGLNSKGSSDQTLSVSTGYAAPTKQVLSGLIDISGNSSILRANGSVILSSTGDLGTGNFGNHVLNVGARNNAGSLFFNGKLFSFVVRGAATSGDQLIDAETWMDERGSIT